MVRVFRKTWPACQVCGGDVVPTEFGARTPAVVVKVLLGRARYGGSQPPDVSCGGCGAEIDL